MITLFKKKNKPEETPDIGTIAVISDGAGDSANNMAIEMAKKAKEKHDNAIVSQKKRLLKSIEFAAERGEYQYTDYLDSLLSQTDAISVRNYLREFGFKVEIYTDTPYIKIQVKW